MTHLIIHHNQQLREEYLIKLLIHLLERGDLDISTLEKIPDIHILNREKDSIGIEEVKDFTHKVLYKPFEEKYQVGIIEEAQALTTQAQNALLKTLEEAPTTTVFILMVNNEKKLLETIVSRCVKHYVKTEIEESHDIEKPELVEMDLVEQFQEMERVSKKSRDYISTYLDSLAAYYRQQMHLDSDGSDQRYNINCLKCVDEAKRKIRFNASKKITLENFVLQITREI